MPSIVIPGVAKDVEGNDGSDRLFEDSPAGFRSQQIVLATAISPDGSTPKIISSLGYRPDSNFSTGAPSGATFSDVVLRLSYTPMNPEQISSNFANNVTGFQGVYFEGFFNGSIVVPPHTPSSPDDVAPFFQIPFLDMYSLPAAFFFDPTQGNLLIDITATTPPGSSINIDGALPGGATTSFGVSGAVSQPDPISPYRMTTIGSSMTGQPGGRFAGLVPGDTFKLLATGPAAFVGSPTVLWMDFGAPSAPLNLGLIGATGNSLYVNPVASFPVTWGPSMTGVGHQAFRMIPVPADPLLEGVRINAQVATIDLAANALGVVTTNGASGYLGAIGGGPAHPISQVAGDASSSTGVVQYGANAGVWGGAVLELSGPNF